MVLFVLVFLFFFKGSHKTEELRHWSKVFFFLFCYKPVTIFLDFVWGGRPQLEEEKTDSPSVPVHRTAPTQEYCHPPETF